VEKIKKLIGLYKKEVAFAVVIVLTASLSFGLGYFVNHEFNHTPIIIEACSNSQ